MLPYGLPRSLRSKAIQHFKPLGVTMCVRVCGFGRLTARTYLYVHTYMYNNKFCKRKMIQLNIFVFCS